MTIFYLTLRVVPTNKNPRVNDIAGALAHFWICTNNSQSALNQASFRAQQYEWHVVEVQDPPIEVTQNDFVGSDIGLDQYRHAQKNGIAMAFAAWSKDGRSSHGPVEMKRLDRFNLDLFLSEIKRLKKKGRCLHFDAGNRCLQAIDAHSIQRNGALSLIAENGHVYAISRNFEDVKRNSGRITYTKQGIGTVSTFRGFCEKHDSQLFKPIDTMPLMPTPEQTFLYAYRALCREAFVKENALDVYSKISEESRTHTAQYELFDSLRQGTELGLRNLVVQKRKYEGSLYSKSFSDIKSVIFCTNQKPSLVFSGLFYPDFDFHGNPLQDLADHNAIFSVMTFSFAPMTQGWGILFAWHSHSSAICMPFMRSLAAKIHEDGKLEDHLFRLVISNCENMAIGPEWWESIPDSVREIIMKAADHRADVFAPTEPNYLARGMHGLSPWRFESVISDMD
jgi:hypothetical protein